MSSKGIATKLKSEAMVQPKTEVKTDESLSATEAKNSSDIQVD